VRAVVDEVSDPDPVVYGPLVPNVVTPGSVSSDQVAQFDFVGQGRTVLISAVAVEGFDPLLTVRDAGGQEIASDDDGGGIRNSLLVIELDDGVNYRIDVEGFSGRAGDFELSVLDQERADELSVTGAPVGGVLAPRQRATYSLDSVVGREVTIDVHGESSFDPTLRIRDANGEQLLYEDDTNGRDPQLSLTVAPGTVAEVAEYSNRGGDYTITVSCGGAAC
jgi:hypothetical protein